MKGRRRRPAPRPAPSSVGQAPRVAGHVGEEGSRNMRAEWRRKTLPHQGVHLLGHSAAPASSHLAPFAFLRGFSPCLSGAPRPGLPPSPSPILGLPSVIG